MSSDGNFPDFSPSSDDELRGMDNEHYSRTSRGLLRELLKQRARAERAESELARVRAESNEAAVRELEAFASDALNLRQLPAEAHPQVVRDIIADKLRARIRTLTAKPAPVEPTAGYSPRDGTRPCTRCDFPCTAACRCECHGPKPEGGDDRGAKARAEKLRNAIVVLSGDPAHLPHHALVLCLLAEESLARARGGRGEVMGAGAVDVTPLFRFVGFSLALLIAGVVTIAWLWAPTLAAIIVSVVCTPFAVVAFFFLFGD